jgi:hypothetical protein
MRNWNVCFINSLNTIKLLLGDFNVKVVKGCLTHAQPQAGGPPSVICLHLPSLAGGHSSIHNLRTCHAVVTGTHLT